ncbi:hypothetical protein [Gracilimonas sediminicola]|uniref:hypothetical protein n=1 Tax=Gracilimonas sediminicola TaxID=2952158 RepID=UPI0038D3B070
MQSRDEQLGHGPRITRAEFEERITSLYERGSSEPSEDEKLSLMRKEFDYIIDHRLGVNFPEVRRKKLWEIRRKTDASVAKNLFFFFSRSMLEFFTAGIADTLLKDYREVLTKKEFNAFFDLKDSK